MDLYLLRHGLAGQHGDPKYKDDSLRPLTDEGQARLRLASLGMKNLALDFDLILSSPYLRAKQTAQIVAQTYSINKLHLTNSLLPPTSAQVLLQEIAQQFPKAKSILAVGHEPHLTLLISELLESNRPLNIDFKKGGLCCLNIEKIAKRPRATFHWLLTSSQLSLIKKNDNV